MQALRQNRLLLAVAALIVIIVVAAAVYFLALRQPETVELTIEYGQPWEDLVKPAIEQFKREMEARGVRVEIREILIPYGVDIAQRITSDLAAGTAGDILIVDSFLIPSYAEAGYLLDITDLVNEWPDWEKFPEPMQRIVMYQGRVYGVMIDTDVRMIWYRKDIFEMAGLPRDWQPRTWEEILEAARILKQNEDKIKAALGIDEFYPLYIPAGTNWGEATTAQGFYMLLLGADKPPYNRLYDYENNKWICRSTALWRAFKFYIDVYSTGLGPVDYNFVADVWGTHRKVFAEGRVAMNIGGSWEWNEGWGPQGIAPIPNREEVVGFAKMPGYRGGAEGEPQFVTVSGGWAVALNAKLAEDEDKLRYAWEFVKILASKENLARYAAQYGKVAPRLDAREVPEYARDPYLSAILEFLEFTDFRDALPGYPEVSAIIQEVTERIAKGEITDPDEALNLYCEELKRAVGEDNVIELPVRRG